MPRQARVLLDGGCYHLLTRGNNRATVFHDAADFQRYGQLLLAYFPASRVTLYHYCLMTNHVHLIVEATTGAGLQHAMHGLNLCYAQAYKRRHGHSGHFWQDRFKSLLIAKDAYLLQCGAYVELNPVRARMVPQPAAYPWSSYRAYAEGRPDPLVTFNPLYATLGRTASDRQARYRAFVLGQPGLPAQWLQQRALGSPGFLTELQQRLGASLAQRPRGRPRSRPPIAIEEK